MRRESGARVSRAKLFVLYRKFLCNKKRSAKDAHAFAKEEEYEELKRKNGLFPMDFMSFLQQENVYLVFKEDLKIVNMDLSYYVKEEVREDYLSRVKENKIVQGIYPDDRKLGIEEGENYVYQVVSSEMNGKSNDSIYLYKSDRQVIKCIIWEHRKISDFKMKIILWSDDPFWCQK